MTTLIYSGIAASVTEDDYILYVREALYDMINQRPNDQFIWLSASDPGIGAAQLTWIKVSVPTHPLLKKFWFERRISHLFRKYQASQFLSLDGFCIPNNQYRQILVWPVKSMDVHSGKRFYRKYMPLFLRHASKIIVPGEGVKQQLADSYGIDPSKMVELLPQPADVFKPLLYETAVAVREKYADNRNYFLYAGEINAGNNVIGLLKAFSLFKKRQKSDWKLVFAGKWSSADKILRQQFDSYKYREDVVLHFAHEKNEKAQLTGAAYAVIDASNDPSSVPHLMEAMSAEVPVIAGKQILPASVYLPADVKTPVDLADKMMQLYKDESIRASLITKANDWLSAQSVDPANKLAEILESN